MAKKNNGPVKRYMIVQKKRDKVTISFDTINEGIEAKEELLKEMSKSKVGGMLYGNVVVQRKRYDKTTLSYRPYEIISRLATLRELDAATITKYQNAEDDLVEYAKIKDYLSKLLIAYRIKGGINTIKLLTPEETEYVISRSDLSNKIIELMAYEGFNIYNFCNSCDNKTRYYKTTSDLEKYLEIIENAAERYDKGATDTKLEIETAIRNFVDQLYNGTGETPKYKRFREIGLYVKSLHDKYQKPVVNQAYELSPKELERLFEEKYELPDDKPMQLTFNLSNL